MPVLHFQLVTLMTTRTLCVLYLFALLLVTFIFKEGRVSVYDFKVAMAGTEKCKMLLFL